MTHARERILQRTQVGSRARAYVEMAADFVERHGRGAEVTELRAAYEELHGTAAPSSFTSEICALSRRGVLVMVGGRSGRTLYAPAGMLGALGEREDDDARIVLAALQAAHGELQRPLSTREIAQAVRRRAGDDHPSLQSTSQNAVRKCLETLARERSRGAEAFRTPQVRRITVETAIGRPSAYWVPAATEGTDPALLGHKDTLVPRSRAEAARRAVGWASAQLGRPVTKSELRWSLMTAESAEAASELLRRDALGAALTDAAHGDRASVGQPGRLHAISTRFTCHGGLPPRYSTEPPSEWTATLCEFEDTLLALRVADEFRSIKALERRGYLLRSEMLEEIAWVRRRLLRDHLMRACGSFSAHELTDRLLDSAAHLDDWRAGQRKVAGIETERWRRHVAVRQAHAEAALQVLTSDIQPSPYAGEVLLVGDAASVPLASLEPLVSAAAIRKRVSTKQVLGWLEDARRVPLERMPGEARFDQGGGVPLSHLDRADALLLLFMRFRASRTRVLLRSAGLVLGEVIRDAELLRDWLRRTSPSDGWARRALLVALGLVGDAVPPAHALPCAPELENAVGWILSVVLSEWRDPEAALEKARGYASESSLHALTEAQARVRMGYPFSAAG
jgi:hypothetical protein